jgi:ferredoxin--NADP+ reductase
MSDVAAKAAHPAAPKPSGALNRETVLSVHHWTEKLFSFTATRDASLRFENGQFTMIGLEVAGRPLLRAYSMVSANWEEGVEFLSIKVPDGPLTSRLQHIAVGDTVLVGRKPTGTLLIDSLDEGGTLWLLATGTGLAPFMAIIKDPATYDRFDRVVLSHTTRLVSELAYRDGIEALPAHAMLGEVVRDKLVYLPAVTREKFPRQGRITDRMADGSVFAELGRGGLDPAQDRIMVCGSPEMLADCQRLAEQAGFAMGTLGQPGQFVIEKAFAEK